MLNPAPPSDPKLSAAPSINFRPGVNIYEGLTALSEETGRKISDLLRDFIVAYWPECQAINRNLARAAPPADAATVRQWVDLCQQARGLGLDVATVLRDATETALANDLNTTRLTRLQ